MITMHLTLELDHHLATRLKEAAQNAGLPPAEWITRLIERNTAPEWPASVKALVGAWRDEPWPSDLRSISSQDAQREPL
jgi:hypothetical protein